MAFKNTIQKTGMLEVSKFSGLYSDREYIENYYYDYNTQEIYQKYNRINQFMNQTFKEVIVYRLCNWTAENIYIIGQINDCDRIGLYLQSSFVYNP